MEDILIAFLGLDSGGPVFSGISLAAAVTGPDGSAAAQAASAPVAAAAPAETAAPTVELDAAGLFHFAERAEAAGDLAVAETAYRALAEDPDPELHTEARFRLALLLADRMGKPEAATALLQRILAEKPKAARVHLELARIEVQLGHRGAAARALQRLQAGQQQARVLPAEVERMVRFFASRLAAARPISGDVQLAALADSNINRATRSDTLGTIIGDFQLDRDARARAGLGASVQAQVQARIRLGQPPKGLAGATGTLPTNLQVRLVTSAELYRKSRFSSVATSLQAGPDIASGADRIRLAAGPTWRWYGGRLYSTGWGGTAEWQHPLGTRTRLRLEGSAMSTSNRRNALQDGMIFSTALSLDRAINRQLGGGLQLQVSRTTARDPGYAYVSAGGTVYLYRSGGAATVLVSGSYQRLEADARVFLYPRRRSDDRFSALTSVSLDKPALAGFAPFLRLRAERNRSTLELYTYTRLAAEAGLSRSF